MTQTLTSELADGQRKLVSLAVAGATSKAGNPMINQISNGSINGFRVKVGFSRFFRTYVLRGEKFIILLNISQSCKQSLQH